MTTYRITPRDGGEESNIEADFIRWDATTDTTALYRDRRFLWAKLVFRSNPGDKVVSVVSVPDQYRD